MTKEELKKEAKEKYNERLKQNGFKIEYNDETYNDGYLDSAIPREKRIAELEAQIEKMKRCEICKNYSGLCGCSYHHLWVEDCKANGMKLFELGDKRK